MHWIVTNEGLNFRQPAWKRRPRVTAVAEKTKARIVQGFHLCPLLEIPHRWCLERAAHLVQFVSAGWTYRSTALAWRNLEALAAVKACVSNQVLRSRARHVRRGSHVIANVPSNMFALSFLGIRHRHLIQEQILIQTMQRIIDSTHLQSPVSGSSVAQVSLRSTRAASLSPTYGAYIT